MLEKEKKDLLENFINNEEKYSLELLNVSSINYSIVLITRNRSPFEKIQRNPLFWALDSALDQKLKPQEIIVINDASDIPPKDFTDSVIDKIKKKAEKLNIKINYKKNKKQLNAALSRNLGANLAKNQIIYFIDDDGILRPECSYGIWLFSLLKKRDPQTFILNLPQNTRVSHPLILVSAKDTGKLDEKKLEITGSLITRYPKEYLDNPPKINFFSNQLLKPLELENFQGGNVIIDKEILQKLGGFPDFNSPIAYGEETGLAVEAIKNNYKIFYFPYNNLAGIHLSYGNPSGLQEFYGKDFLEHEEYPLKKMVEESITPRYGSGMRVTREIYFYVKIRNFAIILEEYRKGLGKKWADKTYQKFVKNNEVIFQDTKGSVSNKKVREKIWKLAIESAKNPKRFISIKEILEKIKTK